MSAPALALACGVCRLVVGEEVIIYRPRMVPAGAPPLRKTVCPGCCQPEIARLRAAGHEVYGIVDA